MNQSEPKAIVRIPGKHSFTLYGREALKFHVWWKQGPSENSKGKPYKAEFYEGVKGQKGYTFEPIIGRGGFTRKSLVVQFDIASLQ